MPEPIPSSWDNWLGASLPNSIFSDITPMALSQPWGKHTMDVSTHHISGLFMSQRTIIKHLQNCPANKESVEWVLSGHPLLSRKGHRQSTRLQSSDKALVAVLSDICRAFVLDLMRKEAKGRWPPMANRGQNNAEPVQTKGLQEADWSFWMLQNGSYLSNQILITHSATHLATLQLCWRRRRREEDQAHCQAVKPRAGHFMWVNDVDLHMVPHLKVRIPIFSKQGNEASGGQNSNLPRDTRW